MLSSQQDPHAQELVPEQENALVVSGTTLGLRGWPKLHQRDMKIELKVAEPYKSSSIPVLLMKSWFKCTLAT